MAETVHKENGRGNKEGGQFSRRAWPGTMISKKRVSFPACPRDQPGGRRLDQHQGRVPPKAAKWPEHLAGIAMKHSCQQYLKGLFV
jgi:hypothetical protein